jgi:formylmethanofuran dehydrogenase subunit E
MQENTRNRERTMEFWETAKKFHGHECPGLAIGVRVCDAVIEKMGVEASSDEELVCVTENDACGVDAVQAILGCTMGKGNLIYRGTGKNAFTFIRRKDETAMRFYFKARNAGKKRSAYQRYLLEAPVDDLFTFREVPVEPPEEARIFKSVECEECGEAAPEHKIRLQDGKKVCFDCFKKYSRGW